MCKELEDELEGGAHLAKALCIHLESMGAAKGAIPVTLGDKQYKVTVEITDE